MSKRKGRTPAAPVDPPPESTGAQDPEQTSTAGGPDLSWIAEQLRPLAVPVADLVADPANARVHKEKNLSALRASLRVYGQRKPVVVNRRTGAVEAGNGTLAAAVALGKTHLAAVYVDDDPATAAGFSIADNRTAELAEWDDKAVDALLRGLQTSDQDLAQMFDDLATDLGIVPPAEGDGDAGGGGVTGDALEDTDSYRVLVECTDEAHQAELLGRLTREGLTCRSLIV